MTQSDPVFSVLRKFVRPRRQTDGEPCELCGVSLAPEHDHLIEPPTRKILCACNACAILFTGASARYRRIPRHVQFLADFHLTDEQWEGMHLPINLVFFYHSSVAGRVIAMYPSPAGATESLLPLETWRDLVEQNPILNEFEPDVEALLVKRVGNAPEYFRAPIDECYKLVGLIRTSWRGLSGGTEVWKQIADFYAGLKQRSTIPEGQPHA